jgi:HAMP domain.
MIILKIMREKTYKRSVRKKILALFLVSLLIVTSILGYLSLDFSKRRLTTLISDSIKGIAATTASFISAEDMLLIMLYSEGIRERFLSNNSSATLSHIYEKLDDSKGNGAGDKLNDAVGVYIKYKDLLNNIRRMNKIQNPINIYVADKSGLRMLLTTDDLFLMGAFYNMKPQIAAALSTGSPQSTGIYRDKNGMCLSAYAAVPGVYSQNNKILIEINYNIDTYMDRLHKEIKLIIFICLLIFLAAAILSHRIVAALVSSVKKLDEAAKGLEDENYESPIDVKSDDEIGRLAGTFEN